MSSLIQVISFMFGKRTFILFLGNFSEKVPIITEYHELEELNDI